MPEALMGRKAAGYRQGYAKGVQQGLRKGMHKGIKEGLLRDAILGTTAERLVARCECPILVVRRAPQEEYRKLLAAVDLLPGSENVLAIAAASIHCARASGDCFHAPSTAAFLGKYSRKIRKNGLSGAVSQLGSLSLPVDAC